MNIQSPIKEDFDTMCVFIWWFQGPIVFTIVKYKLK